MFDIGFYEMLVVGVVALIVVGPKDLPRMFRTVGEYVGRARQMARQFQRSMEDAAREADLDGVADAAKGLKDVSKMAANPTNEFMKNYKDHLANASTPASQSVAPKADSDADEAKDDVELQMIDDEGATQSPTVAQTPAPEVADRASDTEADAESTDDTASPSSKTQ